MQFKSKLGLQFAPRAAGKNKINNAELGALLKARLREVHFSGDFLGGGIFSGVPIL